MVPEGTATTACTSPLCAASAQVGCTIQILHASVQVDALKQKLKPTPVVVTPIQTPPAPVQPISGVAVTVAPPPVSNHHAALHACVTLFHKQHAGCGCLGLMLQQRHCTTLPSSERCDP